MKYLLLVLVTLLNFSVSIGQINDVFEEIPKDLTKVFEDPKEVAKGVLTALDLDLTRREEFVVNELVENGSYATRSLNKSGLVILNSPANKYLNDLKDMLLEKYPEVSKKIEVFVTKDPSLNAFATVNNNIYINVGLLAAVENEAQLSYILCHEIMHIVNRHSINASLEVTRELSSFSIRDILIKSDIIKLHRHSISREHETESDIDGLALYLQHEYDANEALKSLILLKEYAEMSDVEGGQNIYLVDTSIYSLMLTYTPKVNLVVLANLSNSAEYRSHPLIDKRIQHIKGLITDSVTHTGTKKHLLSQLDFIAIKKESIEMIPNLMLKKYDFVGLYLSASKAYHLNKNSEEAINNLCYAVQGLFIDKLKTEEPENEMRSSRVDSVLHYFVYKASNQVVFNWAYSTIKSLKENEEEATFIDAYLNALMQNMWEVDKEIVKDFLEENVYSSIVEDEQYRSGLTYDGINFNIFSDLYLSVGAVNEYNRHRSSVKEVVGKIAIVNLSNITVQVAKLSTELIIKPEAAEKLNVKSQHVGIDLARDYDHDIVSLIPNSEKYNTQDYKLYVAINEYIARRMYFEDYAYVDLKKAEIALFMARNNIRYAMSSINIELRKTMIDKSRKYKLSLIYDTINGDLVFWDKRTSMGKSTQEQLYGDYKDILFDFLKP